MLFDTLLKGKSVKKGKREVKDQGLVSIELVA